MKPWFVVNPVAGRVRYGAVETAIRRELAGRDATISPELPQASRGEGGIVVAVGGDGTVNRVINRCHPAGLRLGLIPRGSANDLGAELEIPNDLEHAWRVVEGGWYAQIDLLSVNGARFVTCGGLGLATEVAARANAWKARAGWIGRLARSLGPLVYPLATLAEVRARAGRPLRAVVHADGVARSVDLAALIVSNQARFGRWFSASPLASNRDGHLHLCGIETPRSRARLLRVCLQLLRGRPERCSEVFQLRATSMTIETDEEVTFFGDGEALARGRRFRIEVLPRALKVAVPRPAVLLEEVVCVA
jgi:diacylglycerol kinase (ATP)